MKIHINLVSCAFASGVTSIWFFHHLPTFISLQWLAMLFFITALLCPKKILFIGLTCAYLAGLSWCYYHAENALHNQLPSTLENQALVVDGQIISIPESSTTATHFEFLIQKIESSTAHDWHLPQKVRLNWHLEPQTVLHIGDEWQLSIKLKKPHSTFNPASFDYETWLMAHQISAIGYVINSTPAQLLANHSWHHFIDQLRQNIQQQILQALSNSSYLGMIEALSIGIKDQITPDQWQTMQTTGINHLMAIAGLHLGFVISFIYLISYRLIRYFPRLLLYCPAREFALLAALISAIFYSALSGFSLPTQRALVMLSVALLAQILRRHISPWQSYWLALLAVLLYDPLSVLSESFWLSFIAVGIILFAILGRLKVSKWLHISYLQWVIFIGLSPITLLFFHQFSLVNFLANSIAIPWVAFLTLPCVLLGVITLPLSSWLAIHCWSWAALTLSWLWPIIQWFSSLDALRWYCYIDHSWQLFFALGGVLWLLAPKGLPQRYMGVFGFFPLFFYHSHNLHNEGTFKLILLDVGQGLSAIVQTTHHCLVYDTGLRLDDHYDMGQSVVVPALKQLQVSQLNLLMISHRDNDHSGGAMAVLQSIPVQQILTSAPDLYTALSATLPTHTHSATILKPFLWLSNHLEHHWAKPSIISCNTGQSWLWDGVRFTIMSPDINYHPPKENDRSCVLLIDNGIHRLLLTGDIEKKTEARIITKYPSAVIKSDVIVAPHHGSKSSSSEDFVNSIHPDWVLYPTGYLNKFHFPNSLIVERYQAIGAHSFDTAKDGQIQILFSTNTQPLQAISTRQVLGHFWNVEAK